MADFSPMRWRSGAVVSQARGGHRGRMCRRLRCSSLRSWPGVLRLRLRRALQRALIHRYHIFETLEENDFRILADVDSNEISAFVSPRVRRIGVKPPPKG
jgi:hypothetical protein